MPTVPTTLYRHAFGPSRSGSPVGRFELDAAERILLRDGRALDLPPKMFDVLALLIARAPHLVAKDELLDKVWPGVVTAENTLSVTISRLRAALGEAGRGCIETVPGRGYRFVAPVVAHAAPESSETHGDGDALWGSGGLRAGGLREEHVVPTPTTSGEGVAPVGGVLSPDPRAAPALPSRRVGRDGRLVGAGALAALAIALVMWWMRATPEREAAAHQPLPEALIAYHRGRALWVSRQHVAMAEALAQFKLATSLDSTFALAYVGQAQVHAIGYRTGPEAEAALDRALALDPMLGEAWATRGFVRAFQYWDWAGAEAAFARARALSPGDITTLQWLASLRMVQRRLPEAEGALWRALAIAPGYAPLYADRCEALYYRRAYAEALAACERALGLDPDHVLAALHRRWIRLAAPDGHAEAARRLAAYEGEVSDDITAARLYARLGRRDAALDHVERAVGDRLFMAPFLNPDPLFDFVRDDPRWRAALRRMGLE